MATSRGPPLPRCRAPSARAFDVARVRDGHGRFVERPEQEMRERLYRVRPGEAGVHGFLEARPHESEAILGVDLPPGSPSQDGRTVDQHDALDRWLGAGVKEGLAPGT